MKDLAASHVRIARPSHDLRAAERFWVDGLGLEVLFRTFLALTVLRRCGDRAGASMNCGVYRRLYRCPGDPAMIY